MLAPETVLQNRYRVIRQLGQGGMGAVYEAMDERLDATVALKETLFADERLRKQFEREARLLARMHHPALPRVSDHFSEGDGQFLVMQFIAGDDLDRMMKDKQGPFLPDQVLTWGDQLLDALDYLHTQDPQIVHRDIKPQNLKLTARGQIILLDFGLAKGQAGGVSLVTTSASIFGYTPNYAPLEQIQGLGTDARSDIYALSATLYHLMTYLKPPDALTRAAALVNGQPDPLTPAHEIRNTIGPEVSRVLAQGMSQNREQRFTTAAKMRAALKGSGEVATLIGRAEAATVIFQPSAATLADASRPDTKPTAIKGGETTVVQEPQAKQRRIAPWAIAAVAILLIGVVFGGYYALRLRNNSAAATGPGNGDAANQGPANPIVSEPAAGSTTSTEPISGGLKEKAATSSQPVQAEAKKNEKAAKVNQKTTEPAHVDHVPVPNIPAPNVAERYPEPQNTPVTPATDQSEQFPLGGRRRRLGGTSIRNFPDGTQVLTNPDGTRVVIFPNGARRVFRPGERIIRRKN
jgi:serine/threonine protein kinase